MMNIKDGELPDFNQYIFKQPKDADMSMADWNVVGPSSSSDGGEKWMNISDGIPPIPVSCVVQNTRNTATIEL